MTSIKDVARAAGVSISTVSYALSGKRPVGSDARRRIDAAVRELGYQPNAGARMLAGAHTGIIALSAPLHTDMHAPSQMTFVTSVVTTSRERNYDVLLLAQGDAVDGLGRVVSSSLIDGLVLMDVETHDARVPVVRDLDVPCTFIGVPRDHDGIDCVDLDFAAAAVLAADALIDAGHHKIGLIGHAAHAYERGANFPPRFRDAFLARCQERGAVAAFQPSDATYRGAVTALEELLSDLPDVTGIAIHSPEPVVVGLMEDLRRRGIAVPAQVSIVVAAGSFDTAHLTTPLSVIPLPASELGQLAAERVMAAIQGDANPHELLLLEPELIDLGSIGPPPT